MTLFFQQFVALLKKNVWLAMRNKRSTLLSLLAPFIFLFVLFAVYKATPGARYTSELKDPPALIAPSIPPCEDKFHIQRPCYDFLWSGNANSTRVQQIVLGIMANNPGRPIPSYKVKSFATPADVDAWLYNNPLRSPGALHFAEKNAKVISYGLQTNFTTNVKRGMFEDITFKFQIPLQIASEREIARSLLADPNFSWNVGLKEFPHLEGGVKDTSRSDLIVFLVPQFLFTISMFSFVFQISSIVLEKELKLRQAMNIMGLYDSAYWLSWLVWESFMVLISSALILAAGKLFHFQLFLQNNFAVVFLVFFLFQLNMTAFAFMLSAFLGKSSSAFRAGFWVFLAGSILQIVALAVSPSKAPAVFYFPPSLLGHAIQLLIMASGSDGVRGINWSGRLKCLPDDTGCAFTMNAIYIRLIYTFFWWFLLALYLDNVLPSPNGPRKSLIYFLKPGYWIGRGGSKAHGGTCCCCGSSPAPLNSTANDVDVLEEESTVKQQMSSGGIAPTVAVQIRGLGKTYAGKTKLGCCCICRRTDPFHAIKGLYLNMHKDQLFCLLGPNGAGKTTTINCLTGVTSVTRGDALVYGNSIRSSVGMSNIRKIIGVCPQFDILWNVLTGEEHLELFASIKGLPSTSIKQVVKKSLEEVRLTESAKVRAGSYSGGMKRRLSVASALIGDPRLLILDEPTTGMDPISRRHVWDIIENAKRGRVIVLTTHSMEEADVLGDRIGIMANGRLRCIGTSIRLKSRFGSGFVTNLRFINDNGAANSRYKQAVKAFFGNRLGISPKEDSNAFLTFVIPRQKESLLKRTLGELQDRQREFGVVDIQLGLITLEEVFLNIARQAEAESAADEGRFVTLTLAASGTSVLIPVGAQYVAIPGTETVENPQGNMVEVYWEQDDTVDLCIAGHSPETPVPPNVQLSLPVASPRSLGRRGRTLGMVIDPSQLV